MWIDGSHCTKPCSVVISRISTKYKAVVSKQGQESVKEKVPVLKQKKAQRTSFERALVIQSGVTGQERKSSRLHGPKSRLRTRPALNYSATMPAPVNKDFSTLNDERIKATNSSAYYKASEWQKSTSSNPFKLRLKCLNKEKPLLAKRKWTLQSSKSEDSSKFAKEEKQSSETETRTKEDPGKKVGLSQSASGTKCSNNAVTKPSKPTVSSEKSPLSKLVISCKKAYRYHQPAFHKSGSVKTKEEEPKPEGSKVHKKMNAYTVYTKLRENSIESINCKRYKKRKEVKNKVERCRVRVRDTNALSVMSELGNLKNDGSVEDEVRATLDSLLRDVVSAELDQLLNLENSTSELKDLLRNFCSQYGYNYDKDFSDPQNSVLSFKVTDSASVPKKYKSKTEEHPVEAAVPEPEPKACLKLPTPPRTLKKRRRRKWDSSDDSDEQECPEMLSAMMRSRSKDRRNRLSRQENSSPVSAAPALRKRQRRVSVPLGQFFSMSEDSQLEAAESPDAKPSAHSASELSLKRYSDEDEETDCGENTLSGHMYIPPLSSDDTSEEEEQQQQRPETNRETSAGCVDKNSEQKPADQSDVTVGDGARTGDGDASCSKLDTGVPPEPRAEPETDKRPNSAPDAWSDFAQSKIPADKPKSEKCSASLPNLNSLFRTLKDKSKNGVVSRTSVQVGEDNATKKDSEPGPEDDVKSYTANSPDLDWDSNNLVICLDPQPSENSMDKPSTDESRNRAEAPPSAVREILYHTPKFHLLESQVPEFFKLDKGNAKPSGSPPVTCTSPTCEVESEESAKEDDQDTRSRSSPQARKTNAKESTTGCQQVIKHHRTPVQKVFPHVKTLSPTQKNGTNASQASRKESSSPANQKPRTPPKIKAVAEVVDVPPSTQTQPANHQPTTSSSLVMPPAVYEATAAPTVYVPPLPTPSSVPLQNGSVPSLAVVPTSLQALSELSVSPLSVTMPPSVPIHTSSASDLFPISDPLPVVSLSPLTVTIPSEHSPKTRSLDVTAVAADISQLTNQSAIDISILRTLLLDPPPDGGPPSEIHNLILQKAKELEEPEQSEDCDFNLPVITNVVSLNEEVIRQAAEKLKSSKQSSTPQVSPVPKAEPPQVQEQARQRSTDSPEIVEEKLKPTHASSKSQHSSKSGSTLGDNINDVLRNLQLEIRNLEKMAEDKKKEYFLIMYVRNFKRDTLRRLHEGLQTKSTVSPTSRKASQCSSAAANDPGQTHPKETCLVRPMVQTQPSPATLLPSPKAMKVSEIKTNTAEPQKGMTILKLLSESQASSRSYSPEVRHSPGSNTPSPIHSSLAALSKIESELKVGFRSYQCPNSKKDSTPEKNGESGIASFAKYEPSKLSLKASPPVSVAQQGAQLTPSSSSAVTVGYAASPVSTAPHVTPLAPSKPPPTLHNPSLSSWKGTVSAYIQNSRGPGKPHYPGTNPPGPPPAYPNTVKNLLKQASAGAAGPVPSLVKDFSKTTENPSQTQRAHVPQGSTQVNSPPFLDYYPFQTVASAANNYIQSSPFWPANLPTTKPNTSLASLQAARDLYLNSLAFGAWRTVKSAEQENERFVEKNSSEKLWNPAASASAPGRPFLLPETQEQGQNLVSHRPFLYGPLRKCVVCKVADAQFICSGCGKDWYCSVTCQRQNWRVHSRSCVSSST